MRGCQWYHGDFPEKGVGGDLIKGAGGTFHPASLRGRGRRLSKPVLDRLLPCYQKWLILTMTRQQATCSASGGKRARSGDYNSVDDSR